MNSKYGEFPNSQVNEHKKELHNNILALLYMKEENCSSLDNYFVSLLWKLNGYNEAFGCDPLMVDIISILSEARAESKNIEYDHRKYRKLILDAFNMLDRLKEGDHSDV